MKPSGWLVLLACAAWLSASTVLAEQESPPPVFGEELEVRVVNFEVVVTDRKGNRVSGLKPEDFRLRVDGKEVPVEYFTEVKEGRAVTPAGSDPAKAESGAAPGVGPEGVVPTWYLVFIDDFFSYGPYRDTVLKALKDDLARLAPEDRMAIVAYDGGRLSIVSNWSGSRNALERAFDEAMARPSRGAHRITELRSFLNDEGFARQVVGDEQPLDLNANNPGLNEREYAFADTLVRQVQGAVGATVSAMRGFGGPEGRKVLLLLSGGWPFSPQGYVKPGVIPTRSLKDAEELFRPLTSTANLLGYTIYPVDVPGLQTLAADATAEAPGAETFNLREQEIEGSVEYIAKQTGGRPLMDTYRTAVLDRASSDTRSYYWLGFSPDWKRNDKSHKVKVEVRRAGLEARSRTGFLDLSRKAEGSMKVESALLFGNMPGAVPIPMRLGPPERPKKGTGVAVPVTLGLPAELMTMVPVNGKYSAQLELRFAASDSEGNGSDIPVLPITLTSDKPPAPGKMIKYKTTLTLRGKADRLVVAVYDPLSGRIATAEAKIEAH